jgi:periplasmic divalent cation tolerance protein
MLDSACIVMTTFSDQKVGDKIIQTLLDQQLSACIQELPIKSHYRWEGKVVRDDETLLLIKTTTIQYQQIEQSIKELHDYDTPEIIMTKVNEGSKEYLSWIDKETK